MNIVLTNDDGIYAEGIYAIYLQLKKLGEVTVVAPDSERSSVGHGITLSHPIFQKKVNRKGKFFGYGISGTPADCVKYAIGVLKVKPDLIVSGINQGPNEGCSIFYSGTVAGAREGALMGYPSMAVSLDSFIDPDFSYAAKCGAKIAREVQKQKLPKGTFLNVNVPHVKPARIKGIKWTKQCMVPIHGTFQKRKDPNYKEYHWLTGKLPTNRKNNDIDTYAMHNRYVAVTPIQADATDYTTLANLKDWNITV